MNLQSIKSVNDISLQGITAEMEQENGQLRRLVLRDAVGGMFILAGDYGFRALIKAPPKMVKKWVLTGEFRGLPVNQQFEHEHDANARLNEIQGREECLTMTVQQIEVPEDADCSKGGPCPF
jgi:hypothetical protein